MILRLDRDTSESPGSAARRKRFFITHSSADAAFASRLASDLHACGLEGFFDTYSLEPGADFVARINKELQECDVYAPILSSAALESQWCSEEINAATALSNQASRLGRPTIIPLLIEDCVEAMPPLLRNRTYVNFEGAYLSALYQLLQKGFGIDPSMLVHEAGMLDGPMIRTGKKEGDHVWWGACDVRTFGEEDEGKLLRVSLESRDPRGRRPWIELWRGGYDGVHLGDWIRTRAHVTRTSPERNTPLEWTIEPGTYTIYFVDYLRLTEDFHPDRNDPFYAYGRPYQLPDYSILYRLEVIAGENGEERRM